MPAPTIRRCGLAPVIRSDDLYRIDYSFAVHVGPADRLAFTLAVLHDPADEDRDLSLARHAIRVEEVDEVAARQCLEPVEHSLGDSRLRGTLHPAPRLGRMPRTQHAGRRAWAGADRRRDIVRSVKAELRLK